MSTGLERERARTRILVTIAAIVIALAGGLAVGRYLLPATKTGTSAGASTETSAAASDTRSPTQKTFQVDDTPHGPSKIVNNVPMGYTHDAEGLAAAGINWLRLASLPQNLVGSPDVRAAAFAQNALTSPDQVFPIPADGKALQRYPTWVSVQDVTDIDGTVYVLAATPDTTSLIYIAALHEYKAVWDDGDWKIWDVPVGQIVNDSQALVKTIEDYGMKPVYGYFVPIPAKD